MLSYEIGIDWGQALSDELPAGPDMQYTPEFAELEAAATGTPEQEYGDVLIPAKAPEWQRVLELSSDLSRRTHDLRVVLPLVRAATRVHGLPGLVAGIEAIERLLTLKWQTTHPQLVIDGIDDPHIRYGILSELAASDGLVSDVRQAVALHSPLGAFTVRDLEKMVEQGSVELNGVTISRPQRDDMVRDMRQAVVTALRTPEHILTLLGSMRQIVETQLGSDLVPDWSALERPLERLQTLLADGPQQGAGQDAETTGTPVPTPGPRISGVLTSRADVVKAMDAICAYLEQHEPTNPAPLLVRRARRLMTMNFLDIVKDMSPDGINQVMFIAGQDPAESE